jgi:Zn finger protein HypA/HybF involved in hydrogenase expression
MIHCQCIEASSILATRTKILVIQMTYLCIYCLGEFKHNSLGGHIQKCRRENSQDVADVNIEANSHRLDIRTIKSYFIRKHGERCMDCGWDKRNPSTNKVPIEIEHIDGNSSNNSISNLKLICPNCHSLTPTYKNLNKGKGRHARRQRYKNGQSW